LPQNSDIGGFANRNGNEATDLHNNDSRELNAVIQRSQRNIVAGIGGHVAFGAFHSGTHIGAILAAVAAVHDGIVVGPVGRPLSRCVQTLSGRRNNIINFDNDLKLICGHKFVWRY
jgi:hypothetical protein